MKTLKSQVRLNDVDLTVCGADKSACMLFAVAGPCLVTIPLYDVTEVYRKPGTVAFVEEVILRQEVIEMLSGKGISVRHGIYTSEDTVNEMHIGGPLTNDRAWTLFLNHFSSFKYRLHEQTVAVLPEKIKKTRADIIDVVGNESEEGFVVGGPIGKFIRFDNVRNDCAIIAKLVPSDFSSGVKKTAYFMFGSRLRGTEAAVRYFLQAVDYLNERFGDGHFFVSMDVNNEDATIDLSKDFVDLTDVVF